MQQRVFGHMLTAKAQIRQRIRAVWSGLSLSADRTIGYYRMYQWRANARMRLWASVEWTWICAFCACSKAQFRKAWPIVKVSIFLKNRHFIIQERFTKLIYDINTIIKCGTTACKILVSLSFVIEWFLSYRWINVANIKKNHFIFWSSSQTNTCCQMPHVYDSINTTYQFIKPLLDKKMCIFEEYEVSNAKRKS